MKHRKRFNKTGRLFFYSSSAALLILFTALATPIKSDQSNPRLVTSDFFGMDIIRPKVWPTSTMGSLGKGAGTAWRYVEPYRDVFKWHAPDEYVEAAEAHGIDAMYCFDSVPQWASSRPDEKCDAGPIGCAAPPADIRDWEHFVTAVVNRFKGRIKIYELWNEPTTQGEWTGTYEEMVQMARSAYEIIKSVDPNAIVLTPAPSAHGYQRLGHTSAVQPDWMREYLKAGGDKYADGGSWHAYPWPNVCDNNTIDCAGAPLIKQVDTMREVFDRSGLAGKPIYVTEGGYRTSEQLSDPNRQAAYVARWYVLLASNGVTRAYWHAWDDNKWGTMWDPVAGVLPTGIAYEETYNWLVGATLLGPCQIATGGVWTCSLTRPNGYQGLIAWVTTGSHPYTPGKQYMQFRDLAGGTTLVQGQVTLGEKPILLETGYPKP
jgi:polysaccharide biosynthesis protein PslG